MGGVGSVDAWIRDWRESNFGRCRVGSHGSIKFWGKSKIIAGVEILV